VVYDEFSLADANGGVQAALDAPVEACDREGLKTGTLAAFEVDYLNILPGLDLDI